MELNARGTTLVMTTTAKEELRKVPQLIFNPVLFLSTSYSLVLSFIVLVTLQSKPPTSPQYIYL